MPLLRPGYLGEMCHQYNPGREYRLLLRNAVRRLARAGGDPGKATPPTWKWWCGRRGYRICRGTCESRRRAAAPYIQVHAKRDLRLILPDIKRQPARVRTLLSDKCSRNPKIRA